MPRRCHSEGSRRWGPPSRWRLPRIHPQGQAPSCQPRSAPKPWISALAAPPLSILEAKLWSPLICPPHSPPSQGEPGSSHGAHAETCGILDPSLSSLPISLRHLVLPPECSRICPLPSISTATSLLQAPRLSLGNHHSLPTTLSASTVAPPTHTAARMPL